MPRSKVIEQEELKDNFHYDPETGIWTNLKNRGKSKLGKEADYYASDGYKIIWYKNKHYRAHVLAWVYMYDEHPNIIDHINGKRDDNRLCNLRNVTMSINLQNQKKSHPRKTYSDIPGVLYEKRKNVYRIRLMVDGIYKSFGHYNTVEEAEQQCIILRRLYYPGNTL